jgi:hypothetical protein
MLPGGPALVAECEASHDAAAQDLLQALAQRHAAGPPLRPGAIVDVGWALLQLRPQDAQTWQVCAPDYDADPMDWHPGLDATLAVLDSQAALMRSLNLPPLRTRSDQLLRIAPGALEAPSVYLERKAPAGERDSGWYAGVQASPVAPDRRQAPWVPAGRLVAQKPAWLAVLALPEGCMAFFDDGRLQTILDAADREIYPVSHA